MEYPSRWLKLYPTSHRDATSAALALFSYIVDYGAFDILISFEIDEDVDAYTLVFGSTARKYFRFPTGPFDESKATEYLRTLNQSLDEVQAVCRKHQQAIVAKRTDNKPQLTYVKSQLVLRRLPDDQPHPHKLHPRYLGPYEVLRQVTNDVECGNLSLLCCPLCFLGCSAVPASKPKLSRPPTRTSMWSNVS